MPQNGNWILTETSFDPAQQNHKETIFTTGNGYLATRGTFEEGFPGESRATLIHGVFDAAPIVFTELANAPDWLPFTVYLDGERFSLDQGVVEGYERRLDLKTGLLKRTIRWRSPAGRLATIAFERFASLAEPHTLYLRCQVTPEYRGALEFRAELRGCSDNQGLAHWLWLGQGAVGKEIYLRNRTRRSGIECATAMRLDCVTGNLLEEEWWDVENAPTRVLRLAAVPGQAASAEKVVAVVTSREAENPQKEAIAQLQSAGDWRAAFQAHSQAWEQEWERSDIIIEGDDEAQVAMRFNLFQMLIAAPRHDNRVSIGAKSLSGFGYRGHAFWDTEIFMLPLFIYTAPHIARNLLDYRYHTLPGARRKAEANGYEGAQFAWESADTGDETTPAWVPHYSDPTRLVRIWTGDIEIHISADIAHAVYQYWQATGDDAWFIERGAEIILDTAKFWGSRAEWNAETGQFEYNDVIGPDEYHEHANNNFYTNRMAQWNLDTAFTVLDWLASHAPETAAELRTRLDLSASRLLVWRSVAEKIYLPVAASGLIEQFDGYFQRKDVDLAAMEPRSQSVQAILGIEGTNETQVLKQPDVLMLLYVLREHFTDEAIQVNDRYYTPRTDHTFGSSLGPSIQAILACELGKTDEAYEHFIRAARADLRDVRGNAGDGIHAASAGGTWQSVVFGFGGLRVFPEGWTINPRLPAHWSRLAFKFYHRGQLQIVDINSETHAEQYG